MVRVIIVDDDADARLLLRIHLGRLGRYEVVGEAANVVEGINLASREQPDVIVLDELLPGGPGHHSIPTLRGLAPRARIVVWSSLTDKRDEIIAAGADVFLDKLAGPEKVVSTLDGLLPAGDD